MTREEAIKILDPETSKEAIMEMMGGKWDQSKGLGLITEAQLLGLHALRETQDNGWIAVRDLLPETGIEVLAFAMRPRNGKEYPVISIGTRQNNIILVDDSGWYGEELYCATHWRPLPDPPAENEYGLQRTD